MNTPGSRATKADPAPMLVVSDASFGYGDAPVLDGVTLEVRKGTCTCLMGMNGCGKSTLLDCILGEHKLARGSVSVGGVPTRDLSPAKMARLVSYVPQVHERSFPYDVEHIVSMGRAAHLGGFGGMSEEDREIVWDAMRECAIDRFAARPYTSLSGGEMQMVMLARALAQRTPLVLMDEPTAHLDFRNEILFLETVERLVERKGATVLMATHAPNQAFHLATAGVSTRVALMGRGRIVREGPPRLVLDQKSLAEVFGVEACIMEQDMGGDERPLRQIVARRTVDIPR